MMSKQSRFFRKGSTDAEFIFTLFLWGLMCALFFIAWMAFACFVNRPYPLLYTVFVFAVFAWPICIHEYVNANAKQKIIAFILYCMTVAPFGGYGLWKHATSQLLEFRVSKVYRELSEQIKSGKDIEIISGNSIPPRYLFSKYAVLETFDSSNSVDLMMLPGSMQAHLFDDDMILIVLGPANTKTKGEYSVTGRKAYIETRSATLIQYVDRKILACGTICAKPPEQIDVVKSAKDV